MGEFKYSVKSINAVASESILQRMGSLFIVECASPEHRVQGTMAGRAVSTLTFGAWPTALAFWHLTRYVLRTSFDWVWLSLLFACSTCASSGFTQLQEAPIVLLYTFACSVLWFFSIRSYLALCHSHMGVYFLCSFWAPRLGAYFITFSAGISHIRQGRVCCLFMVVGCIRSLVAAGVQRARQIFLQCLAKWCSKFSVSCIVPRSSFLMVAYSSLA